MRRAERKDSPGTALPVRKGSPGTALPVRKGSLPAAAAPPKLTPLRRAALLGANGSPGGWGAGCMRSRTIRILPSARRSDTFGAWRIESSSHLMGEAIRGHQRQSEAIKRQSEVIESSSHLMGEAT